MLLYAIVLYRTFIFFRIFNNIVFYRIQYRILPHYIALYRIFRILSYSTVSDSTLHRTLSYIYLFFLYVFYRICILLDCSMLINKALLLQSCMN